MFKDASAELFDNPPALRYGIAVTDVDGDGAFEAVVSLAGLRMAELDPELGANLMVFFVRGWDELLAVPDLDRLVPGLADLVERLLAGRQRTG